MATSFILAASAWSWAGIAFESSLIVVLLAASATFSASEAALFSLTRVQLERAATSPSRWRRLAAGLMQQPKQTLMTILIANTAVNVLLFANTSVLFYPLAEQGRAWLMPVVGIASVLLVVVCGEVTPKILGVALADRLAPFCAPVIRVVGFVAQPLGRVIDVALAEPFVRVFLGGDRRGHSIAGDLSAAEVKALLEMSRRSGALRPLEDTFLRPIVDLGVTHVRDVMVPRVEISAYDINEPPEGLRELMRSTRRKKIPVYEGSLDNPVGLVYAKVLFLNPDKPLRELVQPVRFVPELITCEQLLMHFRQSKTQLAIAVDEYGGVAGLVTLEDVLEQIVGDIHGPEDKVDEPDIEALPNGQYEISGQLSVHYWVEAFGLPQRVERVATVGGLVMAELGRAASLDDVVRLGNVELRVARLHRRRIERLHLRLLEPAETEQQPT